MRQILIIKGADVCYDIMNYMADQLGDSLRELGCEVLYYDIVSEGFSGILKYAEKPYYMIIGFQMGLFSFALPDNKGFIFDYVKGPIFNFLFDHPIWCHNKFVHVPSNYYVLTHDRNYLKFIKDYYPEVKGAYLLPPGGTVPCSNTEKTKDIVFIGTYRNYRDLLINIRSSSQRSLANKFLLQLRKRYNTPPEDVLRDLLKCENIVLTNEKFLEIFDDLKYLMVCVNSYYREKVIRFLLEKGMIINVYGESWKSSPFVDNPNLIIMPEVTPEQSIKVYQDAKFSLNIMTWHKDGYTERIANSMLAHSIVVSDRTKCLEEQYETGKNIVLFDLKELEGLYRQLETIMTNDNLREEIAEDAYQRAINEDTWLKRAEILLSYALDSE